MFLQMWSRCGEICSMPQRQTDYDRDLAKLNPWGQKPGKMRYMFVNQVKRNDCRMSWVYKSLQFVFRLRQLPTGPPCCIVRVFQDSLEPSFRSLTMNSNLFSLTHPFLHMDMLKCIIFLPQLLLKANLTIWQVKSIKMGYKLKLSRVICLRRRLPENKKDNERKWKKICSHKHMLLGWNPENEFCRD